MACDICGGRLVEREVTYTLEYEGKLVVIEHVPAKLCTQCGERLFAPETVARLQETIWQQKQPVRFLQTPVFAFGR